MSVFGNRMFIAWSVTFRELGDVFVYTPMVEVINDEPIVDPDRTEGSVNVIITSDGIVIGRALGLHTMHQRSTEKPQLFYRKLGLLANVQKFDRFYIPKKKNYVDRSMCYEVADGPRPYGFNVETADMKVVSMSGSDMVAKNTEFELTPDEPPF